MPINNPSVLTVNENGAFVIAPSVMDFTGAGVGVSGAGATATVNISGGGGGGGAMSCLDTIYKAIAEANTILVASSGGAIYDQIIDKGGFVIIGLCGTVEPNSRTGTGFVIPAGCEAIVTNVYCDNQSLGSNGGAYYKAALRNVTSSINIAAPLSASTSGSVSAVFAGSGNNSTGTIAGNVAVVNNNIPFPAIAGSAGDTLQAMIGSAGDGNYRPVFTFYVLAIIDATTHQLLPVV